MNGGQTPPAGADNQRNGSDLGTTDGQRDRFGYLSEQWQQHQRTLGAALGDDLAAFNRLVRDRNVPAVVVK